MYAIYSVCSVLHRIIGTAAPGMELDDSSLDSIWAELAEHELPVLLHPIFLERPPRLQAYGLANVIGRAQETTQALSRLLLGGVLTRHPNLLIIAAHGAGCLPFLLGRLQRAHELSPDSTSSPTEGFAHLYVDSIVLDARVLSALATFLAPERILLGSDYPFPWELNPVAFVQTGLQDGKTADGVLGVNASALFHLGHSEESREQSVVTEGDHNGAR